jgi:hypothetical protein
MGASIFVGCARALKRVLRSQNAHARDARAITPSGTPTPAPIAISRLVFDPLSLVGLVDDVGVEMDAPDEVAAADD